MAYGIFNQNCWQIWMGICSMTTPHIKTMSYAIVVLCHFIIMPFWARNTIQTKYLYTRWNRQYCKCSFIYVSETHIVYSDMVKSNADIECVSLYNSFCKMKYSLLRTLINRVDCIYDMKKCFKNKWCTQWSLRQV